jgi:hypothetical protein
MHYSYGSNYSQRSSEVRNWLYGLSSKQMNMSNKASEKYLYEEKKWNWFHEQFFPTGEQFLRFLQKVLGLVNENTEGFCKHKYDISVF